MSIVRIFKDYEELCGSAAEFILELARQCVGDRGFFTLVLSGGSTPRRLYELLASAPYRDSIPWEHTHIFWGDERCVPPDHPESNYRMAAQAFLGSVPLPPGNIHRMKAETAVPASAAVEYESEIRGFFSAMGCKVSGVPVFDCILLGIGNDGHTASLFPGDGALLEDERWVSPATAPPEMTVGERITLTLPVIDAARRVLFLVSGDSKRRIVREIFDDPDAPERFPAAMVDERFGVVWYLDFPIDDEETL